MIKFRGFAIGLALGCAAAAASPALAAAVKSYAAVEARYAIYVNDARYADASRPALNVEGATYVPLRAVGELLGATATWDAASRRVDIRTAAEASRPNPAFRNVVVAGSGGRYVVKGEARVFEATMQLAVTDGRETLSERTVSVSAGAPAWAPFELSVDVPAARLPTRGTLIVELFEYSAKDGSKTNVFAAELESFD